jgi:hypothetical protein
MIPKSGYRFSETIMRQQKKRMIPKSGYRFSETIMRQQEIRMIAVH